MNSEFPFLRWNSHHVLSFASFSFIRTILGNNLLIPGAISALLCCLSTYLLRPSVLCSRVPLTSGNRLGCLVFHVSFANNLYHWISICGCEVQCVNARAYPLALQPARAGWIEFFLCWSQKRRTERCPSETLQLARFSDQSI